MSQKNRERELFEECLGLIEEEREKHLEEACGRDPDLKKRVLLLLRAHEQAIDAGLASEIFGSWLKPSAKESKVYEEGPENNELQVENLKSYCNRCESSVSESTERCDRCGSERPSKGWPLDFRLDQVVAGGQYRVIRRLGSGGFGVVYEVETVVGKLRRALKVLKENWIENNSVRDRFINEALMLEQINHSNVARCFSAGTLEDGELYLLFEYIDGVPLSDLLKGTSGEPRPLDPLRAVRIAKQIASGLVAAHSKQVLHRDLKPANLLILQPGSSQEKVKLLDFGVAKLISVDRTSTGELIGTPAYMAPEQFFPDLQIGTSVDLWQLGAVLFTMLTGRPPYADGANSIEEIISAFRDRGKAGPVPSELNSDLAAHPSIDQLVSSLLSTSPSDRPDSAVEVCQKLAHIEQSLSPALKSTRPALLDALCAQPSENSWSALCKYLAGQDESVRQQADEKLASWPTSLRRAAVAWWEGSRQGEGHPLWNLARTLDLSGRGLTDDDIQKLASCSTLSSIRRLHLATNNITQKGMEHLAQSPYLAGLEWLDLGDNQIRIEGVKHISSSPHLRRLRCLNLSRNRLSAQGLEILAQSDLPLKHLDLSDNDLRTGGAEALSRCSFKKLEKLILRGNLIGPDGTALLAVSPLFENLRELDLARNAVGPGGSAALAVSKNLRRLRSLVLSQNNLGREGLQLLLSSPGLENLESLEISSNSLGPNGAMALASSRLARRLRKLDISDNRIEDAGLASLLGTPHLTGLAFLGIAQNGLTPSGIGLFDGATLQLDTLDLSDNPLGDAGVTQLGAAISQIRVKKLAIRRISISGQGLGEIIQNGRGNVLSLDASNNELGPDGLEHFVRIPELASMRELILNDVDSGQEGLASLVSSSHLFNVYSLSVDSNSIGDQGIMDLVSRSGMPNLQHLSMQDNQIGPEGAATLTASPLVPRIQTLNLSFNRLGDAGAEALAHGTGWQQLQELRLKTNEIGFGGAAALISSSGMDMLQVLDLSGNPLRGDLDMHSLGRDKIGIMETSFSRISAEGTQFAERFYEELFSRFPGVKPLFANTTMSRQKQHLLSSLVLVIENLRKPDAVEHSLTELGKRHVGYGVNPSQYYAVTSTLLDIFRETLEDEWNEEVHEAWSEGLEAISRVMMNAHRHK